MKFKNTIFLGLVFGFLISFLFNPTLVSSFQYKIGKMDFKIKTSGVDDSWNIYLEYFGQDMIIDLNNCIYVMMAENYFSGIGGSRYYGDIILIKYNESGNLLWRINLEGLRVEDSGIAVDSKSNLYLLSMYKNDSIDENIALFKFNSSGIIQWQIQLSLGEYGEIVDIFIDSIDYIYIYGMTCFENCSGYNLFIAKYNFSGDQQWFRIYGEMDLYDEIYDLKVDSTNNIIILGGTYSFFNQTYIYNSWLKCYDQFNVLKWNISCNKSRFVRFTIDTFDNVILVNRYSILKLNNSGNLIWKKDIHIEYYWKTQITLDSSNNIYVATSVEIPEDHNTLDLYLLKINSSGSFDWYLTWGGKSDEDFIAINIDSYDNVYLLSDYFLLKNPKNNGKSLTNIKLWIIYLILLSIFIIISGLALYYILKHRIPKNLRYER